MDVGVHCTHLECLSLCIVTMVTDPCGCVLHTRGRRFEPSFAMEGYCELTRDHPGVLPDEACCSGKADIAMLA